MDKEVEGKEKLAGLENGNYNFTLDIDQRPMARSLDRISIVKREQ